MSHCVYARVVLPASPQSAESPIFVSLSLSAEECFGSLLWRLRRRPLNERMASQSPQFVGSRPTVRMTQNGGADRELPTPSIVDLSTADSISFAFSPFRLLPRFKQFRFAANCAVVLLLLVLYVIPKKKKTKQTK